MGKLFDAVLDVTLVYPDGIPKFWNLCCGDSVRVIAEVRVRPCDDSLVGGDYQNDRAYRRDVHQWLTGVWQEKDDRIDALRDDSTVLNRRIPFLKFFIKQELIWFPLLGVAWWAMDMPFMKRYTPSYLAKHPEKKGKDLEATRKACEKFKDTPTSVINFIEGTRFSEAKRDARHSPYRNLLAPRAGGIAIALSSMGKLFDAVLDVTLVYPDGIPKFWNLCCGDSVRVIAEVRVRPCDDSLVGGDYQNDRAYRRDVHQWLTGVWQEKDDRIDALRDDSQSRSRVA